MAVVLADTRRQVLLLRRQFLFLRDLPGGGVEHGERPEEAAVRETREETGYAVEVVRTVGVYRHLSVYGRGDQVTHAFEARVVGGGPRRFGLETAGLAWCDVNALPTGLETLQRAIVEDALAGGPPVTRWISFPRWKLWPARAAFGLLRALRRR